MTHLSITDGAAAWGENVTDNEYQRPEHASPSLNAPSLTLIGTP